MASVPADQPEAHHAAVRARIDPIVADYVASRENVGLVVGVVHGSHKHVYGWGRVARNSADVPDGQTVFEIGSITKVFTANLLADFMLAGRVRLMDRAGKFLPATVTMPAYRGHEIKLFHLATHTSSLPRLPDNLGKTIQDEKNPYANYAVEDLHAFLNGCRLRRMVGSRVEYSNLGMGLLGHLLSLVDGRPYGQLVTERICQPLGMANTSVMLSEDQRRRLAQGHDEQGEPVPKWDLPTLAGAGALNSTAQDMLRYLEANLGSAPAALQPALLKCQILRRMTAKPRAGWRDFALAGLLAGGGLAVEKWWPVPPGSFPFLLSQFVPVAIAAWWGGLWPGLFAGALCVAGAYGLWGNGFGWYVALPMAGVVAWYCSRGRREGADGVMLGWQHSRLPNGTLLLWHNGGTGGYASWCGIVKETQTGVVVLSNSANGVDDLGERIVTCLNDLDEDALG
jgi:CubicO group peptidase (beta-lactamase class C family)